MTDRVFISLRAANSARQAEWVKDSPLSLSFRGNELAGEVGEACNIIKKLDRERLGIRGSRATVAQLAEELADVVICADLVALMEGIDLDEAVAAKFNATSHKVGLRTRLQLRPEGLAGALQEAWSEVERLTALINSPEVQDFQRGVELEAAHQVERWGSDHDAGKEPEAWFWLIGWLGGKAVHAARQGDQEKARHHCISTAAVLANWFKALSGAGSPMRPGIAPPEGEV